MLMPSMANLEFFSGCCTVDVVVSDCPEIFREIFLKYFKNFTTTIQVVLCIVHCNKVSKPVKGKYLLLCMNIVMYLLLT